MCVSVSVQKTSPAGGWGAGRIDLLPVGVLLVLCTEVWTRRIRSIPVVFQSPPLVKQRGVH